MAASRLDKQIGFAPPFGGAPDGGVVTIGVGGELSR
jgi:hypothetical protein